MNAHSSKQYDHDLEIIRSNLLQMGGHVEQQYREALHCLRSHDVARADQVIASDADVNRLEMVLDEDCSRLIVRRQPAANDLRAIIATLKVSTELERVGDRATKVARISKNLSISDQPDFSAYHIVKSVALKVENALHEALDAFARLDQHRAQILIEQDAEIDQGYDNIVRYVVSRMIENSQSVSLGLDVLWVAKAIERIGDHAKNISEFVIYVVEGRDVRHPTIQVTDTP